MLDRIDWTHPSCRDLVIEELINDSLLKKRFLQNMSLEGVKLAISDVGGGSGKRRFPLMDSQESWIFLLERCLHVIDSGNRLEIVDLFKVLRDAMLQSPEKQIKEQLLPVLKSVCEHVVSRWNNSRFSLTSHEIREFCETSLLVTPLPALPALNLSWSKSEQSIHESLDGWEEVSSEYLSAFGEWISLVKVIGNNEPRFLRQVGFPEKYAGYVATLLKLLDQTYSGNVLLDEDEDELRDKSDTLQSMIDLLDTIRELDLGNEDDLMEVRRTLAWQKDDVEDLLSELVPDEEEEETRGSSGGFSVDALFVDL